MSEGSNTWINGSVFTSPPALKFSSTPSLTSERAVSGGQLRSEKPILLKNSTNGKFYFSLRAQLLQAHRRMAHSTEPGQRSKRAKILSYIPDPLNLFKDNELPSRRSFPGHYHSSCTDQCFLRSSFHLFISFGNCIFF